ncbi:helix-turn-helix transcriptional regulator [Jatrophihabitans sp.]|uniref:helix-turn-helix domain-containing protein n=1 Tax=Jatrophihabitans sp. TaxID=1932789 RepID=UPI0030C742AA|nr:DNA-binding transcriptional regulator, XRE-family domain [Jatrophihabitans sp.]
MPSSTLRRHNGLAIRTFRIKAGMKPGEFATKASLSYAHLDNLENERKDASVEVLYRIATALDVPVRAILRDPAILGADLEATG